MLFRSDPTLGLIALNGLSIAVTIAASLKAKKLLVLTQDNGIKDTDDKTLENLSITQAQEILADQARLEQFSPTMWDRLQVLVAAIESGVRRITTVSTEQLLREIYTYEGAGTMVYSDEYCCIRPMKSHEVSAIYTFLKPGMDAGILYPRSFEEMYQHVEYYVVCEIDGQLVGVGGLVPHGQWGEIISLWTIHRFRSTRVGDRLISYLEERARQGGFQVVFACTIDPDVKIFFQRYGYVEVPFDSLPPSKRDGYQDDRHPWSLLKQFS